MRVSPHIRTRTHNIMLFYVVGAVYGKETDNSGIFWAFGILALICLILYVLTEDEKPEPKGFRPSTSYEYGDLRRR